MCQPVRALRAAMVGGGAENRHQLQVEHVTRGGQNHRDCRAQRLTNDSIPTFSLTGGKSHQSGWGQSTDLQTSVRTSTSRMPQPSLRDSKKKKNRQGELCNGERANCIAQITIPRATAIPAEKFWGAIFKHYIECA